MIAPQALPPAPARPPHVAGGRTHIRARDAARRRARSARLRGYAMLARICVVAFVVLAPVMAYVVMMGNITALNYSLAQANARKLALEGETQRLDDRIAALESRDRLAAVAAQLHMHDPHVYAVVALPPPAQPAANPGGIAFLGVLFRH